MFRRNVIYASLIGLAFCVLGCGSPTTLPSLDGPEQDALQSEAEARVQPLGRYVLQGDHHHIAWPGSGLAFIFDGTRATIDITDDGQGIMDLSVNGELSALDLKAGTHNYVLVDGTQETYAVQLTRRTEVFDTGIAVLGPVEIVGTLRPMPTEERRILFIGDSITAGFGVRGNTKDCDYAPETNAPTLSYAWLTAKALQATPHLVAISGRGVVHNWDYNPQPVMPIQIDFALPDAPDTTWEHSQWTPDVIVTTLGTNDWSVIDPGRDKFRAGYRDMLAKLRTSYPEAHIVTVGGPLLTGAKASAIRDGIDWAMEDLDDPNISTFELSLLPDGLKWSCNSHPGRDSMRYMALQLTDHIASQTGWVRTKHISDEVNPPDWMVEDGKRHFSNRVKQIAVRSDDRGEIAVLGDSISEGWLWRDGWPSDVMESHAVGWDVTEGLLARAPLWERTTASTILIMIGSNDLSYDRQIEQIVPPLREVLRGLKGAGGDTRRIILHSVLPRGADKADQVRALNAAYVELAKEMGVDWLDLTPHFDSRDGTLDPALTYDGLHLNDEGFEVWKKILKHAMK